MKKIFIFDLDGTLCNLDNRLHLISDKENKKWDEFFDRCDEDRLYKSMGNFFKTIMKLKEKNDLDYKGYNIIIYIWTARPFKCFEKTKKWMKDNLNFELTKENSKFRKDNDMREDYIIKEEFLKELSEEQLKNIHCIYDDKLEVVSMYRRNGLVCYLANQLASAS